MPRSAARFTMFAIVAAALTQTMALASGFDQGVNPWLARELTREELLPSVDAAADYFVRNQLRDGQFVFMKDPLGRCCKKEPEKYSLIRHLGAVFAEIKAFELTGREAYLKSAVSGTAFVERFLEDHEGHSVVHDQNGRIGLGENGFMLINAVLLDHLTKSDRYRVLSASLADFIMQNLTYDGPFKTAGQWAECQAVIGLLLYYKHGMKDQRLIRRATEWLSASMRDERFSHWSVQATRALSDVDPNMSSALASYAVDSAKKLLTDVVTSATRGARGGRLVGAKNGKWGSCGVTARNEGLIAGYTLARRLGRASDAHELLRRIEEHIAHSLQFQYGTKGNLYEGNARLARVGRIFALTGGVFNKPKDAYVRIDYVSHHIRAITAYLDLEAAPKGVGLNIAELDDATSRAPGYPLR